MTRVNLSLDLLKLQTNLIVFNKFLMHMEFEENCITLPVFSKTNIRPDWIHFYKFTQGQIEFLSIQTLLRLIDEPADIQSIQEYLKEIENDPVAFFEEAIDKEKEKAFENDYLEKFNGLDEESQLQKIEDQTLLFQLCMALSFNYISVMMHGLSMHELLSSKPKPSLRDIYSAVKVDKCVLFHEKVQKEIAKQQFDGNTLFFESLSKSVHHVKFKTDKKIPRVYYALSLLEKEQYIIDGRVNNEKCTADQLMDIIFRAGFYHPKKPSANVKKFREMLKNYHDDRKHRLNPHNN